MTTVRDIIAQAYRKIGVIDASGDEFAAGLEAFNNMLHSWKARGVNIWDRLDTASEGYPDPFTDDADFAEAADFPMPLAFRSGTIFLLAAELSPEYSAPVTWDADRFFRQIQAAYTNINTVNLDPMLYRRHLGWVE